MEKIKVETREQLDALVKGSAFTMIGFSDNEKNLASLFGWFREHTPVKRERVHIIKGAVMNATYGLTDWSAYKDDLTIVCVELADLENPSAITLPRFGIGGRWFDDVVANNAVHQKEIDGEDE